MTAGGGKKFISQHSINRQRVERVADFRFLGVQIEKSVTWSTNTSELLTKAQQRLYFLRGLLPLPETPAVLLAAQYRIHQHSSSKRVLQRVIDLTQKIISCLLPLLREGSTYPQGQITPRTHSELLPSGRQYRAIRTPTNKVKNSFYPTTLTTLNKHNHTRTGGLFKRKVCKRWASMSLE